MSEDDLATWQAEVRRAETEAYEAAITAAAAAIRAFNVDMRLTILPTAHQGEVVVRDLREELAAKVEGLA